MTGLAGGDDTADRVGVVVLTHDRADELMRTLQRLVALPERPPVVVVDNASGDGTAARVTRLSQRFPQVSLLRCARNLGAAARNLGVERLRTPYVAFCDDDCWWASGSLARAAALLDAHPAVVALSARVLVGPDARPDPTCERMARSPLPRGELPGPALISFMAGAAVVRRAAFLAAGGYEPRFFLGGEELLIGLDLLARGGSIVYADELVLHHHPSPARDRRERRVALARNRVWLGCLRLPWRSALRLATQALRDARAAGVLLPVLGQALPGLPWALRRRRVVPPAVQQAWCRVQPLPDAAAGSDAHSRRPRPKWASLAPRRRRP